eukprot:7904859-Alexandrium_andersonii.AAC.1
MSDFLSCVFKQLRKMQTGARRSKLELRGPRKGLDISPRSSRGIDEAAQRARRRRFCGVT